MRGREQSGRRPVLVVASASYLRTVTGLVIVVPITSVDRHWPNHIDLKECGLPRLSWAMTEQPRTLGRERLVGHAGRVDRATLAEVPPGSRLLEIGAARSRWLPYFAQHFGLQVTGLDYSQDGCEQARAILARSNRSGDIVCADLFAPPPRLLRRFDVVWAAGGTPHCVFPISPSELVRISGGTETVTDR